MLVLGVGSVNCSVLGSWEEEKKRRDKFKWRIKGLLKHKISLSTPLTAYTVSIITLTLTDTVM